MSMRLECTLRVPKSVYDASIEAIGGRATLGENRSRETIPGVMYSKFSASFLDPGEKFRNGRAACPEVPPDVIYFTLFRPAIGPLEISVDDAFLSSLSASRAFVERRDERGSRRKLRSGGGITSSNAIAQRQWQLWKLSVRSYYLTTTFLSAILATSENYWKRSCYLDICPQFSGFALRTSAFCFREDLARERSFPSLNRFATDLHTPIPPRNRLTCSDYVLAPL